jgi:Cytochrome c oxidase caa3 assembly factor (Caa3_CtaG)
MAAPAADATRTAGGRRPSPGLLIAAVAEIAVAFVVATILFSSRNASSSMSRSDMADMRQSPAQIHWQATTLALAAVTVVTLIWWLATRSRIPAVVAAVGLVAVGVSGEVRALALQSHLAAMATLEALLVAAPLLFIAALRPRQSSTAVSRSLLWAAAVVFAVTLNSALLIALHLPAIHDRGMDLATVPLWLAPLVILVGLAYWAAILLTSAHVEPRFRRGAMIVGQEVAAVLGLAVLIRPFPGMHHINPFGLSPAVDQRLGGILMFVACAAVAIPLAKRIAPQEHRISAHPPAGSPASTMLTNPDSAAALGSGG